jgi:hypothetical protein
MIKISTFLAVKSSDTKSVKDGMWSVKACEVEEARNADLSIYIYIYKYL